jgi:pSer/pThr/pTyr-binding forkhead associated (FHA) protein
MGYLRGVSSSHRHILEPEHLIGRAPSVALRIDHRYISGQHALIRWNGNRWEVKDLGSRNGTFLNGVRLNPGADYPLRTGSKIAFGKVLEQLWELTDDTPPSVMAVPVDEGIPVLIERDLLALPSNDDPQVTIYRNQEGLWVLEQPDESITPVVNRQTFEVAGRKWRFCCAESLCLTALASSPQDREVRHLQLSFAVSRDEEHVQLHVTCGGSTANLGARAFNYLLLTLARRRVADAAQGMPEGECGWIYQEDLAHDPSMAPPQLNIDVHRIRRQFAATGVLDAANIVQRRPRTRQLRIGTGYIVIV